MLIERGARIIVEDWLRAEREEVIYFITDEKQREEAKAFEQAAENCGAIPKITFLPSDQIQGGHILDEVSHIMTYANAVVGAASFSIITTNAVNLAKKAGARFLSLPMHTNDHRSFLSYDFLQMSPKQAKQIGTPIRFALKRANSIHVTTKAGTDITFGKKNRNPGLFNGETHKKGSFSSASFEVYVPIEETATNGRVVLDGSMGYIGVVKDLLPIDFSDGVISHIEDTADGKRLQNYIASFNDPEMNRGAEFGIGLNTISRCAGNCYIEDESTFGTFHIGLGRNLALGGKHDASGHFDIVTHDPDIWADDIKIIENGKPIL